VRNLLIGLAIALLVVAALAWTTLSQTGVECEVCIVFDGRERCASAAAATRAEAEQTAAMTACGVLASGVTDAFRCQATLPRSVSCTGE